MTVSQPKPRVLLAVVSLASLLSGCHADTTSTPTPGANALRPRVASGPSTSSGVCLMADSYGADPTGSVDSASALNSALAALSGAGGCIQFGPGHYKFLSSVSFTYPSASVPFNVSIYGASQEATILDWPSSNGLNFSLQSPRHTFNLVSLTIATGNTGSYTGFAANNSVQLGNFGQNNIDQVTFRGDDGNGLTDFWYNSVNLAGVSNVRFDGDLFYGSGNGGGNGIVLNGVASGSAKYGIVFNIDNSGFFNQGIGLFYGSYIQGVQIANSNFTNGVTGIYSPSGAQGVLSELSVTNSQFNTSNNQINLNTPIDQVSVTNSLFYVQPSNSGILCQLCAGLSAVGNNFSYTGSAKSGQNGIVVGTNSLPGAITGNTFMGLTTAVWLQAGASQVNVQSNAYLNNSTNVANSGTGNTIGGGSQ